MAPGTITHSPGPFHSCSGQPETGDLARGTIWQCAECPQEWVLVTGAQYNEVYASWRLLTEANREGNDL